MTSWIGRADLARLLIEVPGTDAHAAQLLRYDRTTMRPARTVPPGPVGPTTEDGETLGEPTPTRDASQRTGEVWHVAHVEQRPLPEADETQSVLPLSPEGGSLRHRPPTTPLATWRALWPRVFSLIAERRASQRVDARRLVRHLSQARPLRSIPRTQRVRWPERLVVWLDRSDRLAPLWEDHDMVLSHLERWCPTIEQRTGRDHFDAHPNETVLLLGELVELTGDVWQQLARTWHEQGVRLNALSAQAVRRRRWRSTRWPGGRATSGTRRSRAEALLVLASTAVLVQPGLLRALRRLLPEDEADPQTELDAWVHSDVRRATFAGLILDPKRARALRQRFAQLDPELQAKARETIRAWHTRMPATLRHIEALLAGVQGPAFDAAAAYFGRVVHGLLAEGEIGRDEYANAVSQHLVSALDRTPALRRTVSLLWLAGHPDGAVPDGVDVSLAHLLRPGEERALQLVQRGHTLSFTGPGMPLATVRTSQPIAWVRRAGERAPWAFDEPLDELDDAHIEIETDLSRVVIERVRWPDWAEEVCVERGRASAVLLLDGVRRRLYRAEAGTWRAADGGLGVDRFGVYEDIEIVDQRVRFRRIPAGSFMMGSPEGEAGRWDDEGPRHRADLDAFWLAEYPTTQAVWQAVMGENPSRFEHPMRPVEQVSWDDAQAFIERVNLTTPGLATRLPTEAEWEYACRAGTTAATWVGELEILGMNNAPVVDTIAWYGGNSGVGFDLDDAHSSGDWPAKQYDHRRTGTRIVGRKAPNPWGLFDTLGNVLEWCADRWAESYGSDEHVDPTGPKADSKRVVRGGSCSSTARRIRAAARSGRAPNSRQSYLGFRLARGLASTRQPEERVTSAEAVK